jgi:hypothetical protein
LSENQLVASKPTEKIGEKHVQPSGSLLMKTEESTRKFNFFLNVSKNNIFLLVEEYFTLFEKLRQIPSIISGCRREHNTFEYFYRPV